MSNFALPTPTETPQEVENVFSDFKRRMGIPFVPNVMRVLTHSPAVAKGTWAMLDNVLAGGTLPRALKEMMMVAISSDRECEYCEAAHSSCCRMLGVDAMTLDTLLNRIHEFTPARSREILLFGVKCARNPQSLTESDFATLKQHGLSQEEILEVIAMSGLAVYINILVDATAIPIDEVFS